VADVNANIGVHIDTSSALAGLKNLQRQLATFHSSISQGSAASAAAQKNLQNNLLNSINATGMFTARMGLVKTSTESFTHALENNKLTMREYFRYAGASTKTFGRMFKSEFDTIGKVAEERVKKMQTQYIKMGRDASGAVKAMAITPTNLNMKDFYTQQALASQKQALFNQLVRQGSTNLLNFGKNTQWAGRQLMVGFSVPLAYFGAAAAKTFMALEAQAVRFKRVYGEMFTTSDQTNKALRDIQLLAQSFTKYGVKVEDTMKMAADAAAMGKMGADLTQQVAQATKLAVLGSVDQSKALETTISLTNAFGISATDLKDKINFLNAVENQTVLNIEDLTVAIPKAAPVVKQLGGSVEDLTFFLTAMKEGGIDAAQGANALKSGLSALINPSKAASNMLATYGINVRAIVEGNAGNIKNTVLQFAYALDKLAPLDRARAIEQMFGKFQFARLSTLFQNITKDGSQANRVLGLTNASVEELAILSEREMKKVQDAVGTNFKASIENLKVSIAPIGKAFLEAVTPIVKFLGKLFNSFSGLDDGVKKFIVTTGALVGIIGPVLLMTFGLVANGIANIIKLFLAMRTGFMKIGASSTNLAEQTSYLNAQQLESATVAASLNQAHTQLTQRFEFEAVAVNALRNAYIEATVAASVFAKSNPGMMAGGRIPGVPRRFADGTPYVPGTGNKDTVPSLLTPGEAVIPRGVAQDPQFQPIINAMVNGSIRKYETGTGGVRPSNIFGPNAEKFQGVTVPELRNMRSPRGTIGRWNQPLPGGDVPQKLPESNVSGRDIPLIAKPVQRAFAHAVDFKTLTGDKMSSRSRALGFSKENAYTAIGFDIPKEMNSQLNSGRVPLGAYRNEILHPEALRTMTSRLIADGMAPKDAHSVAKLIRNNFLKSTRGLPPELPINDKFVYSRMGNEKTGIIGKLVKNSDNKIANAVRKLVGPATTSPAGKSNIVMNGTRPISDILKAVRETRTGQAAIAALERVSSIDPSIKLPVKLNERGEIVGFQRPEVEKGQLSKTQVVGMLSGDKFETGRVSRGGGRQITVTGRASQEFDKLIAKKIKQQEKIIAVQKGEILTNARGQSRKITGTNTEPLPAGLSTTTGAGVDTRLARVSRGYTVTPRGIIRGAETGYEDTKTGTPISNVSANFKAEQNSLRRQIEKQQKRQMAQMKEEEQLRAKQSDAIKQQTMSLKQQYEYGARAKAAINGFSNKATVGMGALSSLTIAASFAGGKLGAMAQSAMPIVFGLQGVSMLLPLMTKWSGLIGLAVAGFAAATLIVKNAASSMRKQMFDLADQVGITSQGLQAMSEFTGKVTAAEQLAYRSKNLTNPFAVQPGKSYFGQSFTDSEQGKSILAGLKQIISNPTVKGQGQEQASQALTSQLSAGIASGVFTAEQARSIAVSIGQQLNNVPLGLKVNAELVKVFGPNGENLLNSDGSLQVNLVAKETQKATALGEKAMSNNSAYRAGLGAMDKKSAVAGILATSATAGLLVGTGISLTGVGAVIAPVAGVIAGLVTGIVLSIKTLKGHAQELAASSTMAIASFTGAIELQNQVAASLKIYYEKAIASAEAAGDSAKADQLRAEYSAKSAKIEAQGVKTRQAAIDMFIKSRGNTEAALLQSAKDKASRRYKGTAEADYLGAANTVAKTVSGVAEYRINFAMGTGALTPSQVVTLADLIGTNKKEWSAVLNVDAKFGGTSASELANIMTAVGDKTTSMKIAYQVENAKSSKESEALIRVFSSLSQLSGEFNIKVIADYILNNKDAYDSIKKITDELDKNNGKLTMDVITKFLPPEVLGSIDQTFFNNLDQNARRVYTTTIAQILSVPDPVVIAGNDYKNWTNQSGKYGGKQWLEQHPNATEQEKAQAYASLSAQRFVVENPTLIPGSTTPTPSPSNAGKRDTTFDDILNSLKRTRDATINAMGGAKELMRILGKKGDLQFFNGIDQQLAKLGSNTDFIDFVGGLEKAIQSKLITISNKGVVALTDLGKATKKAFDEKQLGLYSSKNAQAITATIAQRSQFAKLKAAGVETADALNMVADSEFAISLASQTNAKEIQRMISEWKKLQEEIKKTAIANNPQQYFKDQMDVATQALDVQERMARRTYEPQIAAINKLVDANNVVIEQKQRMLETDTKIGNRVVDNINAEIDALNRSLSVGIDKTLQGLQDQSAKLSEDQTVIGHAVDAINQKYDLQEQALTKISDINQEIVASQKQQISLADAITSGDISAAAQAAQDMRAASASQANKIASDAITAAREAEIAAVKGPITGLTAAQISEQQYQIDRQTYALNQQRNIIEAQIAAKQEEIYQINLLRLPVQQEITRLEDQNYQYLNKQIPLLQNKLDAELNSIQDQRTKWDDAQLAIDLANTKTDDFTSKLTEANGVLAKISALWNSITDKNLKLTIQQIEQAIQGTSVSPTASISENLAAIKRQADLNGSTADATASAIFDYAKQANTNPSQFYADNTDSSVGIFAPKNLDINNQDLVNQSILDSIRNGSAAGSRAILGQTLGAIMGLSTGGIVPKYFAAGGYSRGTDTVPAMLTPGEFVVKKFAADKFGINNLHDINNGSFKPASVASVNNNSNSVYNYGINVNVSNSNASTDDIARAVITQIKNIDGQRIRGQK
jgi:TP901 family phage tail tape measure protein